MAKHMDGQHPIIDCRLAMLHSGLTVRHIGPDELEPYDDAGRLLLNVNTPDDYARAQAR